MMAGKGSRSLPAMKRNLKKDENEPNEPVAKASRQTPTALNVIPQHLLLKVISKLPSITRVRMRKSCSYMNNFVESNRKALAKTFCREGVDITVNVVTFKPNRSRRSFPIGSFQKMLSGLSIERLSFSFHDDTPLQVIEEAFKDIDLVASVIATSTEHLTVEWTPAEYLKFSNIAKALETFCITIGSFELPEYMPSLLKSRNAEQLTIISEDVQISRDIDQALVESMMNCRVFHFKLNDIHFFKQFLWTLYRCHRCNLDRATFGFSEMNGNLFNDFGFPPMKVLWDLKSFDVHRTSAPYSTRLISSENKWIVVAERLTVFTTTRRIGTVADIRFFEKGDEFGLLDFLLPGSLMRKFTPKRRSFYVNSSPEDRFDMLRKFYFDQAKKDGILRQEKFLTYKEYLQKENLDDRRNL